MYSNMKNYENICNCLRVIQQYINRKLKSANCWQRTSLKHVTEHQVPFMCVVCEFRTGDNTKFVRHQESSGHMARVEPGQNRIALQEFSAPRFMIMGQDIVELSKEDSTEHWNEVGETCGG